MGKKPPLSLRVELFDLHAEHVNDPENVCPHGSTKLYLGDTLTFKGSGGSGVGTALAHLKYATDGTLQLTVSNEDYVVAKWLQAMMVARQGHE